MYEYYYHFIHIAEKVVGPVRFERLVHAVKYICTHSDKELMHDYCKTYCSIRKNVFDIIFWILLSVHTIMTGICLKIEFIDYWIIRNRTGKIPFSKTSIHCFDAWLATSGKIMVLVIEPWCINTHLRGMWIWYKDFIQQYKYNTTENLSCFYSLDFKSTAK